MVQIRSKLNLKFLNIRNLLKLYRNRILKPGKLDDTIAGKSLFLNQILN